jgi:hypothetical protein
MGKSIGLNGSRWEEGWKRKEDEIIGVGIRLHVPILDVVPSRLDILEVLSNDGRTPRMARRLVYSTSSSRRRRQHEVFSRERPIKRMFGV